ncbi:MAG TPA: CbiX/SirB N-terminal domain-containing protein [Patescibacteria group bacterium]|nr:CbiX/SirB N-terminal domain-containing protein [Patescibacteria group bacterium]
MSVAKRGAGPVKTGLLVIGHGSRAIEAVKVLSEAAVSVRRRFRRCIVEACFLEINQPDVQAGIDRLVAQGAGRILFVPFSLYVDGHVGRDLPEHITLARARHPGIDIRIAPHLGPDHRLVAVCEDRIKQGLRAGRWT